MHYRMFLIYMTLCHIIALSTAWTYFDKPVLEMSFECHSEGRYADPADCTKYYECLPGIEVFYNSSSSGLTSLATFQKGELVAHQKSCFGNAFHPIRKVCVAPHKVHGCIPRIPRSRSFNLAEPQFQELCNTEKGDTFICSHCKNLLVCVDGVAYNSPCNHGTVCSEKSTFDGDVCYPDGPTECTCKRDTVVQKDYYNDKNFMTCDSEGSEPRIHTCSNELSYNEEHVACCNGNVTECSPSGPFAANANNCNKYSSFLSTIGGWIEVELNCKDKQMFNEETNQCEDPCTWLSEDHCKIEGRFASSYNCSNYFICIQDPLNSDVFIKEEYNCPEGSEWKQTLNRNDGQCVNRTGEEPCIPENSKYVKCNVPEQWCKVPSASPVTQCSAEEGVCLSIGQQCDAGTIKIIQKSCLCCIPEAIACREGFANYKGYCLTRQTANGNGIYDTAVDYCRSLGAAIAYPTADLSNWQSAIKSVMDGGGYEWAGARQQDDGSWTWVDGTQVPSAAWAPGEPGSGGHFSVGGCAWVYFDGLLRDKACTDTLTPICQEDTPATTTQPTTTTTTAITTTEVVFTCDAPATLIGKQCLLFERVNYMSWENARSDCASKGARLAILDDPQAVFEYAKANSLYCWVGASDIASDGDWRWLDGTAVDQVKIQWYADHPTSGAGTDCLWVAGDNTFGYHSMNCQNTAYPICELGVSNEILRSHIRKPAEYNQGSDIDDCVSPWVSIGNSTGCLQVVERAMDWYSARQYCQNIGGDLPITDMDYKQQDLTNYYARSGFANSMYWLGTTDGVPVTDGLKYSSQFNEDPGAEMCLYTFTNGQYSPLLNYCTHTLPQFICEK